MTFELQQSSGPAAPRRGRFETRHGSFETPCFAPCATAGSIKGLLPSQVQAAGVQLVLGNTYHLAIRPGAALLREAGGLHRFMAWEGPILTDSGGYQVFSLEGKRRVSEEGVRFAGADAGAELFLSPRTALEIQRDLGSDIAMVLDECAPHDMPRTALAAAHGRTLRWAAEARRLHHAWGGRDRGQEVFGIVQGGLDPELRAEACGELVALDFDGYAIGGVSVGESKTDMYRIVELCTPCLPEERIRYLMGVGEPDDLFESVLRGVDLFDCVTPTRHGRNNMVYVRDGVLKMRNARHAREFVPIDADCGCPACAQFTRAYVRHLALAKEMLAGILQSLHNLHFVQDLMRELGKRIGEGRSERELRQWFQQAYPGWADRVGPDNA